MTVAASFTADVTSGEAPLTVTFTDTSTGSPTNWFWDFGNGFTSANQNPVHIYTEDGTFTVSLKVWDQTSTSNIDYSSSSPQLKEGISANYNTAFANFLADSYASGTRNMLTGYRVAKAVPGGSPFIFSSEIRDVNFNLSAHGAGSILILNAEYNDAQDNPDSSFVLNGGASLPNPSGNVLTPMLDVSDHFGENPFTINPVDINSSNFQILSPAPGNGIKTGWNVSFWRIIKHNFASKDTETKVGFIGVGVDPPVAAFSGTPRKKLNSLTCQLTDESTNTPTSWSWKRRPSGILAPYVEFSTIENPSEEFDITDPTP